MIRKIVLLSALTLVACVGCGDNNEPANIQNATKEQNQEYNNKQKDVMSEEMQHRKSQRQQQKQNRRRDNR